MSGTSGAAQHREAQRIQDRISAAEAAGVPPPGHEDDEAERKAAAHAAYLEHQRLDAEGPQKTPAQAEGDRVRAEGGMRITGLGLIRSPGFGGTWSEDITTPAGISEVEL